MKYVFSGEGTRQLRVSWVLLAASIAAAVALGLGGKWFLDQERRERLSSGQRLERARSRLDAARRERDSLRESADIFSTLVDRGLLQGEHRLDLVEMVNRLRERHQLFSLDYEIAPQRPLQLSGGRVFPAVEVLASRVKLRARALHEGDVLDFVEALANSQRGIYPLDRCALKRVDSAAGEALQPRIEAECAFEWITLKEKNANRPG